MADSQELRRRKARASRAEEIINDPLVQEAFEAIEQEIYEAWRNSDADDDLGRHNAYLMDRLLRNFKSRFKQVMVKGKTAETELLVIQQASQSQK